MKTIETVGCLLFSALVVFVVISLYLIAIGKM